jgi:hypothetical protein
VAIGCKLAAFAIPDEAIDPVPVLDHVQAYLDFTAQFDVMEIITEKNRLDGLSQLSQRSQDGRMNPFMKGIGLVVSKLNAPVTPIMIAGLFELKKRKRFFALPNEITVTFGEPVRYKAGASPDEITRDLEERLADL